MSGSYLHTWIYQLYCLMFLEEPPCCLRRTTELNTVLNAFLKQITPKTNDNSKDAAGMCSLESTLKLK